jgi:hypothetical protein
LLLLLTVEVLVGGLWQAAPSCADLFLWHQKNKTWHSPLLLEPALSRCKNGVILAGGFFA